MNKPNALQSAAASAACKLSRFILRKTGRGGGTAIPGLAAMRISPDILASVSAGMEVILVTGTNGKTTTCNMIHHAITFAGHDCLLNKSGANLAAGITADLICNTNLLGKPKTHYAVLECDESTLKNVAPLIRPAAIVVTNLFSDQVDRYGGVENTLKEVRAGVESSPSSILVLNSDEPLSASLALNVPNKVVWYGMSESVGEQGDIDLSDADKCPVCGGEYEYGYHIYAHLGGFSCPKCGYNRPEPSVEVSSINRIEATGSDFTLKTAAKSYDVRLSLPAVYNVYNGAATVATVKALGIPEEKAIESLSSVHSSFGRLETFDLNGKRLQMILVKNPAGCNQVFSYLEGLDEDYTAVLCLNDRTGDGHDISWIEDTDYEKLVSDPHLKKIYVCGDRADDLSERLRKAGADDALQTVVTDYDELLAMLEKSEYPIFALPNYTAMMDMRVVLNKVTGNKDFWE